MEFFSSFVVFYSFSFALIGALVFLFYLNFFKRPLISPNFRISLLKSNHVPIHPDIVSPFILQHSYLHAFQHKKLRIFFHPYEPPEGSHTSDSIEAIPTLLFLHGIGGNMDQFSKLMLLFKTNAHLLSLDYVGHGLSPDTERIQDYTTRSLLSDIQTLLQLRAEFPKALMDGFLDKSHTTNIVESATLSKRIPLIIISHSYGCVLATQLAFQLSKALSKYYDLKSMAFLAPSMQHPWPKAKYIPTFILGLLRQLDQRGGIESTSVQRILGTNADGMLKRKQWAWNRHLSNQQLRFLLQGLTWPTQEVYAHLQVPIFVLGGALDRITPPSHLSYIRSFLPCDDPIVIPGVGHQLMCEVPEVVHAHASSFFIRHCPTFNPYTQWKVDTKEKWNLKNFTKWKSTSPIGSALFRLVPMKVLKQDDLEHNPQSLAQCHPSLRCIIDLSKDAPPYDVKELETLGIRYLKVSTASKQIPTFENVHQFIQAAQTYLSSHPYHLVGVHCHYGYNRTGFMIVAYLVEVEGMEVGKAIQAFAEARKPDGIRHLHFKDELYLRYAPHQRL